MIAALSSKPAWSEPRYTRTGPSLPPPRGGDPLTPDVRPRAETTWTQCAPIRCCWFRNEYPSQGMTKQTHRVIMAATRLTQAWRGGLPDMERSQKYTAITKGPPGGNKP